MKQKYQFTVTLEVEVEGQLEEKQIKNSLRSAVFNALDDARESGFVHPRAHDMIVEKFSVEQA
jgi:hypothetical protein